MKVLESILLLVVAGLCAAGALALRRNASPIVHREPPVPIQIRPESVADESVTRAVLFVGETAPHVRAPGLAALLASAQRVIATTRSPIADGLGDTLGNPPTLAVVVASPGGAETVEGLKRAGAFPLGIGASQKEAEAAFATWITDEAGTPLLLKVHAASTRPMPTGNLKIASLDVTRLANQIRQEEEEKPETLSVILIEWGEPGTWATSAQQEQAHALVDAGADLVLGWGIPGIQQVEYYADRVIVYGIGMFSTSDTATTGDSSGLAVRLVPSSSSRAEVQVFPLLPGQRLMEAREVGDVFWSLLWKGYAWDKNLKSRLILREEPLGRHFSLAIGPM